MKNESWIMDLEPRQNVETPADPSGPPSISNSIIAEILKLNSRSRGVSLKKSEKISEKPENRGDPGRLALPEAVGNGHVTSGVKPRTSEGVLWSAAIQKPKASFAAFT